MIAIRIKSLFIKNLHLQICFFFFFAGLDLPLKSTNMNKLLIYIAQLGFGKFKEEFLHLIRNVSYGNGIEKYSFFLCYHL